MQAACNDVAVMNENVKLVQENKRLAFLLTREQRKVAEMEKLLREYRSMKLKGYEKRRDWSDNIRAMWIGAGLVVSVHGISLFIYELWEFLHGWA